MIDAEVDFLLIGGYAVIYHGYMRSTGDMDIWLKPTDENKKKVLTAFGNTDIHPDDIAELDRSFDFTSVVAFHFGMPPERIDFLTKVPGVDFDKAIERKQLMKLADNDVPVLHLDDLIISKIIAARPQDKADVEILQQINQKKKD